MKKYEVWHEITLSLQLGEFEAESMEEAERKAEKELQKYHIEDYQENREFVTSEVEEWKGKSEQQSLSTGRRAIRDACAAESTSAN